MVLKIKRLAAIKALFLLLAFVLCGIILSFSGISMMTNFMILLLGAFFCSIALFADDLFSPWGFLFLYQFLGYINTVMLALRVDTSSYSERILLKCLVIQAIWLVAFCVGYFLGKFQVKSKAIYGFELDTRNAIAEQYIDHKIIIIPCALLFAWSIRSVVEASLAMGGLVKGMLYGGASFSNQGYLMTLLAIASLIPLDYMHQNKYKRAFVSAILILGGILLTGRRSLAITTAIIPALVYINVKIKKIRLKEILIIAIPVIAIILYIGKIRLGSYTAFVNMNTDSQLLGLLALLGKYNGLGTNLAAVVTKIESGQLEHQYFSYLLRGIQYFVPRALWADKPLVHSGDIISLLAYGDGTVGRPAGAHGWAYLNFGMLGVVISGLITAVFSFKFYNWMITRKTLFSIAAYGVLITSFLEVFQPESQMEIILYSIVFYMLKMVSDQRFKRGKIYLR